MWYRTCGVGPLGFLGWASLYKHRKLNLGKRVCVTASLSA